MTTACAATRDGLPDLKRQLSDWVVSDLGSVCALISDGTHQTPHYVSSGVPFYSVEHVTSDDFQHTKFVSEEAHGAMSRTRSLERGDILMTRIGSLGETKLVDWDVHASFYVSLALLRPGSVVDPRYLYAYTKSAQFRRDVEKRSLLWAVPKKINMGEISGVRVEYPRDPGEQRRIAEALMCVESLVNALRQLIAKKRAMRRGMMQDLLTGRTRLPDYIGVWEKRAYRDLITIERGEVFVVRNGRVRGDIPVIAAGQTPAAHTDRANRQGPVVTISASGASAGYVAFHDGPIFASDCSTISSGRHFDLRFIYYGLKLQQDRIYQAQVGGAQPHIHAKDIYPLETYVPPSVDEQRAISGVLADVDSEIIALEMRLSKISNVRQGMMQELLTGKTRLVPCEVSA